MEIKTAIIPRENIKDRGRAGMACVSIFDLTGLGGFGNGYIGLPQDHPWFGLEYDDIQCEVHGGLTFSRHMNPTTLKEESDTWWIGFDTFHAYDNLETCPKTYVEQEVESMKQQAIQAIKSEVKND